MSQGLMQLFRGRTTALEEAREAAARAAQTAREAADETLADAAERCGEFARSVDALAAALRGAVSAETAKRLAGLSKAAGECATALTGETGGRAR